MSDEHVWLSTMKKVEHGDYDAVVTVNTSTSYDGPGEWAHSVTVRIQPPVHADDWLAYFASYLDNYDMDMQDSAITTARTTCIPLHMESSDESHDDAVTDWVITVENMLKDFTAMDDLDETKTYPQ